MKDFILNLNVVYTDEEKEKCIPTVRRIIKLAKISKENGILSLKHEILENDDSFLIMGIDLISDGVHPEYIEKIFQYAIRTSQSAGADLLNKLLIAEGILAIQASLHLPLMAYILGALIDEKYIPDIMKMTEAEENFDLKGFFDTYCGLGVISENSEFESRLLKLTTADLSRVLLTVDCYTLSVAFYKCSRSFLYHMRNGVSENTFIQICKNICNTHVVDEDELLNAQKQVLYNLAVLEDAGQVVCLALQ